MPSIADQVQALEDDNASLLSQVAALTEQLATSEHENTLLLTKIDTMVRFVAETRGMVETLAQDALSALRYTRRNAYDTSKVEDTQAEPPKTPDNKAQALSLQPDAAAIAQMTKEDAATAPVPEAVAVFAPKADTFTVDDVTAHLSPGARVVKEIRTQTSDEIDKMPIFLTPAPTETAGAVFA